MKSKTPERKISLNEIDCRLDIEDFIDIKHIGIGYINNETVGKDKENEQRLKRQVEKYQVPYNVCIWGFKKWSKKRTRTSTITEINKIDTNIFTEIN